MRDRVPAAALAMKADVMLLKVSFVASTVYACWVPCKGAWVPENNVWTKRKLESDENVTKGVPKATKMEPKGKQMRQVTFQNTPWGTRSKK